MRDHPIAARALSILSAAPRAPLRCDRGGFLYVCRATELRQAFERAGFDARVSGELLHLTPRIAWADPFAEWAARVARPGELTHSLCRLRGRDAADGEIELWIAGIKLVELGAAEGALSAYDRSVRQRAARALREGRGGGLLCACAACVDLLSPRAGTPTTDMWEGTQ